jgi:hypothetical protein
MKTRQRDGLTGGAHAPPERRAADAETRLDVLRAELRAARAEAIVVRAELDDACRDLQTARAERQASDRRSYDLARHVAGLEAVVAGIVGSRSWRLTAPLRVWGERLRGWRRPLPAPPRWTLY